MAERAVVARRPGAAPVWLRVVVVLVLVVGLVQGAPRQPRAAAAMPTSVVLDHVESGSVTLAGGLSSVSATIGAVDPARALLTFTVRGNDASPDNLAVTGALTNATTVTFERYATVSPVTVEWSVVEFVSGVSVQRGTATASTAVTDVAIAPVDLSRSFTLINSRAPGTTFAANDFVSGALTSSTNLRLQLTASNNNVVPWQVVTYNDATVQRGTTSFGVGDATVAATVSAVDTGKAWLVHSLRSADGTTADIGQKLVRGRVTDATTVTFDRSSTGQTVDVTWELVEFGDSADVQHASVAFASVDTVRDVTIAAVDTARSIAVGGTTLFGGRSAYTTDDNPGVGWFTTTVTSATNLRVRRDANLAAADLGWFVIEWPAAVLVTVNSTGDAGDIGPGDGVCSTGGTNSQGATECTLRAAMEEANASATVDTIQFAIPATEPGHAAGVWTVTPSSMLPTISAPVTIDATTQAGWTSDPVVRVDGVAAGGATTGFVFGASADSSRLSGVMVTRFSGDAVAVTAGANAVRVDRNWFGTNGSGAAVMGNGDDGIDVAGTNAVLDRNVVNHAGDEGIDVRAAGVTITGNLVGLEPDGASGSGNGDVGIAVFASGATIGGTIAAERNVVSNNVEGIEVNASNTTVQGNYVGTDATGTLDRGNHSSDGVQVQSGSGTRIGGTAAGAGNLIAYNQGPGVRLSGGSGTAVVGNVLRANGGLGIDLGAGGVTPNDGGDGDPGPNDLLNFPVLGAVAGGATVVPFTLDVPAGDYRVEVFGNPTDGADPSGYGEGETLLGATTVTHTGGGSEAFSLTGVAAVSSGDVLTATATADLGGGSFGSTSEFSAAATVTGDPAPVVLDHVESGSVTLAGGLSSVSATIGAVDPARALLTFTVRGNDANPDNLAVTGALTNATTVTFERYATVSPVTVEWSVVEFVSGVSVQRGTATASTAVTDVAIAPVDLSRSFTLINSRAPGTTFAANDFVSGALTSSTNLRLQLTASNNNVVPWQVVTYNDATVQRGTTSFGVGDATVAATVSAVDTGKAWLVHSLRSADGTTADIGQKLVRGRVTDATTVTFDRSSTGQTVDVTWELVEFGDSADVQHASVAFASVDTVRDVTIAAVDTARSIAVGGTTLFGGRSAYTTDDNPGVGWFTTTVTSATNLRVRRDANLAAADLGWFVIEWPAAVLVTVNSTGDAGDIGPGDGVCSTGGTNSQGATECTLRAAMEEANASATVDTIQFAIPATEPGHAGGVWTFTPASQLPYVIDGVHLDATSQPGYAGDPVIELDGSAAAGASGGIVLRCDDGIVEGFAVHSFVDEGLEIDGSTGAGDRNVLRSNWVGIDAAGVAGPNADNSVLLTSGAADNVVGGSGAGEGNVIGHAATDGVLVRGAGTDRNVVVGNWIGVAEDGTTALPTTGRGVAVTDQAADNRIGGVGSGANLIVNSGGAGIATGPVAGTGNAVLGNVLRANGGLGIDLGDDGVTTNDAGDGDTGPNDLLNFPLLGVVDVADTVVPFTLDVPAGDYRVEVFGSPSDGADPSGYGEGETLLGATTVTHTGGGSEAFSVTGVAAVSSGDVLTATATADLGGGSFGSTSEFSAVQVVGSSEPVVLDHVESGSVTLAGGLSSVSATIGAVDPARALLTFTVRGNDANPDNLAVTGALTNATTVTFERYATVSPVTVEWSVVEFVSGVSVQRGTATASTAVTDVAIAPVDLSRSFTLINSRAPGTTFAANDFVSGALTSSTNLRLQLTASNNNVVPWQVVTYNDATVQRGTTSFGVGDATVAATVSAVDTGKAWLVHSLRSADGTPADIGQKLVRGRVTDATTVTFDRSSTGQTVDVTWELVEFGDSADVQHASVAFASVDTIRDVTIAAVDTARSIAVGGTTLFGGRSAYTTDDNPGVGWFTTTVTSATNLRVRRDANLAAADLGWFVIEWPAAVLVTVNSTGDAGDIGPGDGVCSTGGTNSQGATECTLRAAMEEANASATVDTIQFAIPATEPGHAGGVWTIAPTSGLPDVDAPLSIDATTQPGWTSDPIVQLDGSAATGATAGIRLRADDSLINGFVVHSFPDEGLEIDASMFGSADRNVLSRNWVGIDADRVAAPNADHGILVTSGAADNVIGGIGAGNVVAGNTNAGVVVRNALSDGNRLVANLVGVAPDGVTPRPNGGPGIAVRDQALGTVIGGTAAGAGNLIANNALAGVEVAGGDDTAVLGNDVRSNGALGVDLVDVGDPVSGVTPNDADDVDSGANGLLNQPVLAAPVSGASVVEVSLDVPAADYRIELFTNPTAGADASGYGEGETLVHAGTVTAVGAAGAEVFTLTGVPAWSPSDIVTATATEDLGGGSYGATSEFAQAQTVVPPPATVTVNATGDGADEFPGDGACDTGGTNAEGDPECTLRAALEEVESNATTTLIAFAVPVSEPGHADGVWTIGLAGGALPALTSVGAAIDATTQPGWTDLPVVQLDGSALGTGHGIELGADGASVRGLAVGGFPDAGVRLTGSATSVTASHVGVAADGVTPTPNGSGVAVAGGATDVTIGGIGAADATIVAHNAGDGVLVTGAATTDVAIVGTRLSDNGGLAIDLVDAGDPATGVTPNDPGDADAGPNGLLNAPVVAAAADGVGGTDVTADLDVAAGVHRIEWFVNPGGADWTGYGEAQLLVAVQEVSHPGGAAQYATTLPIAGAAPVTATLTACDAPGCADPGATSEVSAAVTPSMTATSTSRTQRDSSVNRQDARSAGGMDGADVLSGALGDGLDLDGVDDRLLLDNLDIDGDSFTVQAWVRPDVSPEDARIVVKERSGAISDKLWALSYSQPDNLRIQADGTTVASTAAPLWGTWTLATATWDGATLRLYQDGVQLGSSAEAGTITPEPGLVTHIGASPESDPVPRELDGRIDEIRVLTTARSADWVAAEHANHTAPTTFVSVGTTQTRTPGPWSVTAGTGRGGSQAAEAPDSSPGAWLLANGIDEAGLELDTWWRLSDLTGVEVAQGGRAVIESISPAQDESALLATTGWDLGQFADGTRDQLVTPPGVPAPAAGTWHRVVTRIDQAGELTVWVDGVQVATTGGAGVRPSGTGAWRVGALPPGTDWWIDDVRARRYVAPEPTTALGPLVPQP